MDVTNYRDGVATFHNMLRQLDEYIKEHVRPHQLRMTEYLYYLIKQEEWEKRISPKDLYSIDTE